MMKWVSAQISPARMSSDNKRKLRPIIDCSSEDESDYEEDLALSRKLEQLAGEMLNDKQIV